MLATTKARKIEDLSAEIATQQAQLKAVHREYESDVKAFEKRKLKKTEREWKSATKAYEFTSTKIQHLITTLELCQSMPIGASVTHQHYGEGSLRGFLFDERGVVMAVVDFSERGLTQVSPHEIKVSSTEVEPDYSAFPSEEMIEFRRSKAIWIRDCILAVKNEADYQALRKSPDFTRDQLNWAWKNLLSDEQQKTYAKIIKEAKPVGVGDTVMLPGGKVFGTVELVQVKSLVVNRGTEIVRLTWDEFELLRLAKLTESNNGSNQVEESVETEDGEDEDEEVTREVIDASIEKLRASLYSSCELVEEKPEVSSEQNQLEIAESTGITEVFQRTKSTPVEVAGTSDADEIERIVEEIWELDRSYRLEIARRLLRLQQIWKPSDKFPSFGDFCLARLGKKYNKSYRNELIAAARVVEERLPTAVSGRLTAVEQATVVSKVLNAGASVEETGKLIEDVLESTGNLSADKLQQAAQERGLLPKKAPKPVTSVSQEVAAAGQSLGLSGQESQQLPDIEPNADIPPEHLPSSLTVCLSLLEVNDFIRARHSEAIAEFVFIDWQERFRLRELTQGTIDNQLMGNASEQQIRQVMGLIDRDKDAKIAWLVSEVVRLQSENDELRSRLTKPGSTRTDEWYTPPEFIEMAREVMGSIDLDPASNELAQSWIKAETFFTKDDDGLRHPWRGNVWNNPPYGRSVEDWLEAAIISYRNEDIKSAILLLNRTGAAWYKAATKGVTAICEVYKRIAFIDENGQRQSSPRYYNDFLYLGKDVEAFQRVFSAIGDVRVMQQSEQVAA